MSRPAVFVACALMIAFTGCAPRAADPSAQRGEQSPITDEPAPTVATLDEGSLTAAGRVALRYALAARTWTATTYEAQYRRQLALSGGPLRRELKRAPPTHRQLAGYRTDDATAAATAIAITPLLDTATQARYEVVLEERSSASGQTVGQRARYLVELRRDPGGWLVTAFTIQP